MNSAFVPMLLMTKRLPSKPINSTEFGLHKSQTGSDISTEKLIDLSEHKLLRLAKTTRDNDRRAALLNLLAEYKAGRVAIAWEAGNKPIYIHVQKDPIR